MPYVDTNLGQHCFRQWLVAWQHQAITWTNIDLSSKKSCNFLMKTISLEILVISMCNTSTKNTFLKLRPHLPGANELTVDKFVHWCEYEFRPLKPSHSFFEGELWGILHHDDIIKWKLIPHNWLFVRGIHRWLTKASDIELWCFLWCVRGWANNQDAGDLRHHGAHCDVTVMWMFWEQLTHWGRVTHICVGNLAIIGSDNGLSPGRRQAIIRSNAGILLIGPLGTNFSEIWIGIQTFSLKKIRLKMSSAKRRPFCLGLNVLTMDSINCDISVAILSHIM